MIEQQLIDDVARVVIDKGASEDTIKGLRQDVPGISFTYCFDDDICGPKPIFESETFNLYLVSGAEHCVSFTNYPEAASGLVVAEIDDFCA